MFDNWKTKNPIFENSKKIKNLDEASKFFDKYLLTYNWNENRVSLEFTNYNFVFSFSTFLDFVSNENLF